MSFSILARCARTGGLGLGVASCSIAIGRHCDAAVRPGVGATFTQSNANMATYSPEYICALERVWKATSREIVQQFLKTDYTRSYTRSI